jgi:cell division protein FtsW
MILKKEEATSTICLKKKNMNSVNKNNYLIIFPFIFLVLLGLVMISSASIFLAEEQTLDPFYYISRQLLFVSVGLVSMSIFLIIPSSFLLKTDWLLVLISILLLIALFVPNVGSSVNGSIRWIRLGSIGIQPSEICKFSLIIYISGYCFRRASELYSFRNFLKPLTLLSIISLLIMSQPDLGSTAIICLVVVAILFYAGISFFQFSVLSLLILLLGVAAISTSPMRIARVMAFRDPFDSEIVFGSGYQLANSLISIGQGGWTGLGLGNSFQKNFFLPEAHTDFIFAILVEELGVIGGIILITAYMILFFGILKVAVDCLNFGRVFQGLVCFGTMILFASQSLFNIAVNIGLLPTKGLTLPFISYGGTSIIIMMSLVAIVLRINNENKLV